MANLTSITFSFQLMNDLFTNDNETNQTNTSGHYQRGYLQTIKHCLINIFPNVRHLMLANSASWAKTIFLQKLDKYFRDMKMTSNCIYSCKIQYVEIKLISREMDCVYEQVICLVKELLKLFENLQSFIFHFYHLLGFPSIAPFTDLSKMIQLLNMEKISEKYQIKHIRNYLQFVKDNNE
jgi:hypothetical protein